MLMGFQTYNDCQSCDLGKEATHRGICTRPLFLGFPRRSQAVLCVGEAPGFHEDRQGVSWVGKAGQLLEAFIKAAGFAEYADVYLSNACRCRPPQNANPKTGQINACRRHLQRDLDLLATPGVHYSVVHILCCGRYALESVTRLPKLEAGFGCQGKHLSYFASLAKRGKYKGLVAPEGADVRVWVTYHPAGLIPGSNPHSKANRHPERVIAVEDHFQLVRRALQGDPLLAAFCSDLSRNSLPFDFHINESPPANLRQLLHDSDYPVTLDIETYGILEGYNQTCFHPVRMQYIDGVPPGKQIVSLCFGYQPGSPHETAPYQVYFYYPKYRQLVSRWLEAVATSGKPLLGQNIKFDVACMRAHCAEWKHWLDPRRVRLDDTLLIGFLAYEGRPERGLKELSYLFGLYDYSRETVTANQQAASPDDPNLARYNGLDCYNTHRLAVEFWDQIRTMYGPDSAKFQPICHDMRNQILWGVILLEGAGIGMDMAGLRKLDQDLLRRCDKLAEALQKRGLLVRGKGSDSSKRKLLARVFADLGMSGDDRVVYTKETRLLSVGKENTQLALASVEPGSPDAAVLAAYQKYVKLSKLQSSYTKPLLTEPARGIQYTLHKGAVGVTHPHWFPMPSRFAKNDPSGASGGTKQGRFSAQRPGEQTFPKPIKALLRSKFLGGKILRYDLSQIELRVLAMLSGDPLMIREYREGIDRHADAALEMFPDISRDHPDFHRLYRQMGKTRNFLVVYRGGAKTLQEAILAKTGVEIGLDVCAEGIRKHDAKYHVMRAWQDAELAKVRDAQGYLEVVTGWSRYWGKGPCVHGKVSEIADFPVQTIAAQLAQSAQFAIACEFLNRRLKSHIIDNIQDSLGIDCCPGEEEIVDEIVGKFLTTPPLLPIILKILGTERFVPLEYDKEV